MRWYLTTVCFYWYFNPVYPGLRMYILHTVLYAFSNVLTRRICLTIKRFFRLVNMSYLHLIWNQRWSLLCHWLSSMRLIQKSHHFFSFKSCLFLSQWHCFTKRQQPIRLQSFVKITNQIRGKWRTTFQLCRNQLSIGAVKYLHRPKHPVFEWLDFFKFQNGCSNKVIIEL